MNSITNIYKISANMDYDGQSLAINQAEILGEAYGKIFFNEYDANELLEELQDSADELETSGPITYSLRQEEVPIQIELSAIASEQNSNALMFYIDVKVIIDKTYTVSCAIGAPESDHGSIIAAGCDVRPYCTAWYTDSSDWCQTPHELSLIIINAIDSKSYSLYREVQKELDL
jgi:hypothetical protein